MSNRKARSSKALSVGHNRLPGCGGRIQGCGGCLLRGFFAIFLVAGLVTGYFMAFRPIWQIVDAGDWVETPCTIRSSEIEVERGDDSNSYQIRIVYDYVYDGQLRQGDRYHFADMDSNTNVRWKRRVVAEHPVGRQTVCFVNPDDPDESILHRGPTRELIWGLFCLPFLAVGIGGTLFGHRMIERKTAAARDPDQPTAPPAARPLSAGTPGTATSDPAILKPQSSAGMVFALTLAACLFWNGITGLFVAQVVGSFLEGDPEWPLTLFMVPFVLVGLGLTAASGYTFLRLFNPRPELTLNRSVAPLGGLLQVRWRFRGNVRKIRHFKLTLKGEERATYRRGTDTHTDTQTFFEHAFYEADHPVHIVTGEAEFEVPADSMHSFSADNNEIVWSLCVHGDIPRWPDVSLSYPIEVTPHESRAD